MVALRLVKFAPEAAGSVAGNLASGIVPEVRLVALRLVKLSPLPLNFVEVNVPIDGINDNLVEDTDRP